LIKIFLKKIIYIDKSFLLKIIYIDKNFPRSFDMIFWRSPPCQEASKGQCAKIFLLLKGKGKEKEKEKEKRKEKEAKKGHFHFRRMFVILK
jgi:hypothetical protein